MSPIVYMPPVPHECEPPGAGEDYYQESKRLYPEGTIWKCDDCGARWEVEHEHYGTSVYGDTEGKYRTIKFIWNRMGDAEVWV